MGYVNFTKKGIFEYNQSAKLRFALITIIVLGLLASLIIMYVIFFKESDIALFNFVERVLAHVQSHIAAGSVQGILYVSVLGGLFFVTLPLEVFFITFLKSGVSPYSLIAFYLGGFAFSFTLNYIIGSQLNEISMKIITPKKFYKFKGLLNKYGPMSILVFNLIPFFPAQPLSAILGVFKYNKAKFYTYFIAGELVKYSAIAIIYLTIFA